MLKLKQLTKKDLDIYIGKKVIFFQMMRHQQVGLNAFKKLNIEVIACCEESISIENAVALKLNHVTFIRPYELDGFVEKHNNIIFQGVYTHADDLMKWKATAVRYGAAFSEFTMGQIVNSFSKNNIFENLEKPIHAFVLESYWRYSCKSKGDQSFRRFKRKSSKMPIICCLPTKTGDVTLLCTLKKAFESRPQSDNVMEHSWTNVWHRPRFVNKKNLKCFSNVKIVVGLREPIAQNLSSFYQSITFSVLNYNWIYGLFQKKSYAERAEIIKELKHLVLEHGTDVQMLWDAYLYRHLPYEHEAWPASTNNTIQEFMLEFEKYVLDITVYPFDKEKGYTVIKNGNTEVFVYQLEKLNHLALELSEWVGVPFDKLENGNQASDKWIGESYKQAQKEIEITQEYFDKCFDEPYVKHCYSEADIEKFKAKWRPHIKR